MKKVLGLMAAAVLLTGCAFGARSPVGAALITADVHGTHDVVKSGVLAQKQGSSCAKNILGIYATGDASIEAGKKAGGIRKVATVDYNTNGIIPFFFTHCIDVYGE